MTYGCSSALEVTRHVMPFSIQWNDHSHVLQASAASSFTPLMPFRYMLSSRRAFKRCMMWLRESTPSMRPEDMTGN